MIYIIIATKDQSAIAQQCAFALNNIINIDNNNNDNTNNWEKVSVDKIIENNQLHTVNNISHVTSKRKSLNAYENKLVS